jgi:type IV secretion system protein VirB10
MRALLTILLVSGTAWGQATDMAKPADASAPASRTSQSNSAPQIKERSAAPAEAPVADIPDPMAVIPAGTKIPLSLAQAISTKNAREGDPVYAQTTFPFVVDDRILVPAGTYIQGKISRVQHAGRSKTRAELLLHFTSMIYPSGYTVMLPASVENTPGADDNSVKDKEGTIQADKDTGKRVEDAAKGAAVGGTVGSIGGLAAGGYNGARYGGLAGIAGGVAWALLKHGPDVKLPVGTSIEMEIQRPISVDASRIQVARAAH